MLNLNYLRYFYISSQSGSFTKAAAKLRISQPALSVQIKTFEEQLGFPLFIRTAKSLQLTTKGKGLFLYASRLFQVTDDIERFLKENEHGPSHSLRIGVSDDVERPFVADVVGRLLRASGANYIVPSIISKKHEEIVQLVADDGADLIITNQKVPQLKLFSEMKIPVMLITSASNEKARSIKFNLQNIFKIIEQNLVLPTDEMLLAKETRQFLKQKHLNVPTALTSNIIACIVRAVQEKLGAAFLPIAYVNRELNNKTLQAFGPKEGFWHHRLYLYAKREDASSSASSLAKVLQDFSATDFSVNELETTT